MEDGLKWVLELRKLSMRLVKIVLLMVRFWDLSVRYVYICGSSLNFVEESTSTHPQSFLSSRRSFPKPCCLSSNSLGVAWNRALLAVEVLIPLAIAVVLAAGNSIARLLADLDTLLANDARVRDASEDVLDWSHVLELLGANFGPSLLECKSWACVAAMTSHSTF